MQCVPAFAYCAINAPPAAGYYPYNPAALDALSDAGKRLIPVCFDKPITTTRLLIERPSGQGSEFLLLHDDEHDGWELPGGEGWEEEGVGWDIDALQALTQTQLGLDIPWMSYIEDVGMPFTSESIRVRMRARFTRKSN
jgi:hypothetical protein